MIADHAKLCELLLLPLRLLPVHTESCCGCTGDYVAPEGGTWTNDTYNYAVSCPAGEFVIKIGVSFVPYQLQMFGPHQCSQNTTLPSVGGSGVSKGFILASSGYKGMQLAADSLVQQLAVFTPGTGK